MKLKKVLLTGQGGVNSVQVSKTAPDTGFILSPVRLLTYTLIILP